MKATAANSDSCGQRTRVPSPREKVGEDGRYRSSSREGSHGIRSLSSSALLYAGFGPLQNGVGCALIEDHAQVPDVRHL